jgi:hypothetical protein
LFYIFFVLWLHFAGDEWAHRYPWDNPVYRTEYLPLASAAKVAIPMALGAGLLMYLVYRPKTKYKENSKTAR